MYIEYVCIYIYIAMSAWWGSCAVLWQLLVMRCGIHTGTADRRRETRPHGWLHHPLKKAEESPEWAGASAVFQPQPECCFRTLLLFAPQIFPLLKKITCI